MPTVAQAERLFRRLGNILTVDADVSADRAAEVMMHHQVGCLVVQTEGRTAGILSERDIVARVVATGRPPRDVRVRDVMTPTVVTCAVDTPLGEVQRLMTVHGIRHVPVTEDGKLVGMISSRDVLACQLYEATSRLAEADQTVRQAERVKSEFLGNLTHELRTPMHGILGITELAMEAAQEREQRAFLSMIKESADSLMVLVNNMLDLSDIQAGRMCLRPRAFSLSEAIGDVMEKYRNTARDKGLDLLCYIAPHLPDLLLGDETRFGQVISNLLSNAVKFTKTGEIRLSVEGEACNEQAAILRVTVADTGIGIASDDLELIFEPFRQVDGSPARAYGGAGLGLPVARRLVEKMGGSLRLTSQLDQGSTFWFTVTMGLPGRAGETASRPAWRDGQVETTSER